MRQGPQDLTGCHKPMQANCSKEIIQVSGERANFRQGVFNLKTNFPKVTEKFINSILRMHKPIWALGRTLLVAIVLKPMRKNRMVNNTWVTTEKLKEGYMNQPSSLITRDLEVAMEERQKRVKTSTLCSQTNSITLQIYFLVCRLKNAILW